MKQETRVDLNSDMYLLDILDPATDYNAKRFYAYVKCKKKDGSSIQCRETVKHTRSGTSPIYDAMSDIGIMSEVKAHKLGYWT